MGFLDKAKDLLSKNADKVDTVIDKAGDLVDKKTQGKYASTVDKVQDAAKKAVADQSGQPGTPGTPQPGTPQKPPVPPQQEPPTAPPVS
ncbi:antitoxin [Mycolicibacterium sp. 018/SC-01/001]|uniref:antitoxin n=1 Tax=Mycolicibacterium sp. 018/SC-01/001 TaxID=2592069 RepID=UPI001180DE78|nr:antitoxin [Mycolicibacterium sp. 018/SC-01/001]TRW82115.1 antitoxin [Mycolicibacterium sp. 018/SC-01/001]